MNSIACRCQSLEPYNYGNENAWVNQNGLNSKKK